MDVCLLWVLSGRGLCDELITRPEESHWLWRVVVCDQEISKTRRLKPPLPDCKNTTTMGCNAKKTNKQTRLVLVCGCPGKTSSIPGRCTRFISFLKRQDRIWSLPSFPLNRYQELFPRGKVIDVWSAPLVPLVGSVRMSDAIPEPSPTMPAYKVQAWAA